jgi:hypothetical protein
MTRTPATSRRPKTRLRGQGLVEYATLVVAIIVVVVAGITVLGLRLNDLQCNKIAELAVSGGCVESPVNGDMADVTYNIEQAQVGDTMTVTVYGIDLDPDSHGDVAWLWTMPDGQTSTGMTATFDIPCSVLEPPPTMDGDVTGTAQGTSQSGQTTTFPFGIGPCSGG